MILRFGAAATIAAASAYWIGRHARSPAARQWRPSALHGGRAGALYVRSGAGGDRVVVLLHGLAASGNVFSAEFDRLAQTSVVVVPDLLGFGKSLDTNRVTFRPDDHLDALDESLELLGLAGRPLVLGAHSMGAALATHWIERHTTRVEAMVCWGAPTYPVHHEPEGLFTDAGWMARVFAANTRAARVVCEVNCAHRTLAGLAAAAARPTLPLPVARSASLHTWPAYRDAVEHVVAGTDWRRSAIWARDAGTPMLLSWGTNDPVGDRPFASGLPWATVELTPEAGHHLPLTYPANCVTQLRTLTQRSKIHRLGPQPS